MLTDLPHITPLAAENVHRNFSGEGLARPPVVLDYEWGQPADNIWQHIKHHSHRHMPHELQQQHHPGKQPSSPANSSEQTHADSQPSATFHMRRTQPSEQLLPGTQTTQNASCFQCLAVPQHVDDVASVFDVIVAADVLYNSDSHQALLHSLSELCAAHTQVRVCMLCIACKCML